jgi:hypothetical protein
MRVKMSGVADTILLSRESDASSLREKTNAGFQQWQQVKRYHQSNTHAAKTMA